MINKNIIVAAFIATLSIMIGLFAILFINGYRIQYSDGTTNFVKGGNLYITSEPKGAEIYIDTEFKGKTPYTFANIKPGKYEIEIKKDGHNSWQDEITITEGFVSNIDISLFPTEQLISTLSVDFEPTDIIKSFDNGSYLLSGMQGDMWFINSKKSLLKRDISIKKILNNIGNDYKSYSYDLSNSEDFVLVKDLVNKKYFILTVLGTSPSLEDSAIDFIIDVDDAKWGNNSNQLIIESNSLIFSYNINTKNYLLLHNSDRFPQYSTNTNRLVFLDGQTIQAKNTSNIPERTIDLSNIPESPVFDKVFLSKNNDIFLSAENNLYYLEEKTIELVTISNSFDPSYMIMMSPDDNKFVFKQQDQMYYSYIINNNKYLGKDKLNQIGDPSNCIWRRNSENLICLSKDSELYVVDYDGSNSNSILVGKTLSSELVINESDELFTFEKLEEKINILKVDLTKPAKL